MRVLHQLGPGRGLLDLVKVFGDEVHGRHLEVVGSEEKSLEEVVDDVVSRKLLDQQKFALRSQARNVVFVSSGQLKQQKY